MIQEFKEKWTELEARKRAELEASLERDDVADPFSSALLISFAISAALSAASYVITRAFAPKPPRQELGKLSGSLQLQNSEQGIFIPEIYGGSPSTSLVSGSNPTYQNLANVTAGANGAITKTSGGSDWNAGASHNVSISSGQDAFYEFTVGTGYATAGFTLDSSPTSGNTDFLFALQWNPDGSISIKYNSTAVLGGITTWVTGDTFRLELRSGRFRVYKGSAEIVPDNFIFPSPSYPLYMGIAMQFIGAGVSASKVQISNIGATPNSGRGGVKVPAIIVWSSGIRKIVTTSEVQTGGGKGGGARTQTVDNVTYNIDLGLMFCRGPVSLIREYANADILIDQYNQSANPSGVYDPGTGADPDYDPTLPPDPTLNYQTSYARVDGDIPFDVDNVGTGTILGGGSSFAIYPGNATQDPDPMIEADIDAKYGAGSTPAYRNHSLIAHNTLPLSRWGGVVPNITAVWEHETLRTLDLIYASLCERVGVKAANSDYDFTGIPIASRGLAITGRPFAPREIIASPDIQCAYNYFVTEAEGQIIAYEEGNEPSVTIPDTDVGWIEGDADLPDIAPEIESIIAPEISLPREVNVKSIDPDNDWEPNTANAIRQITDGSAVTLLEIQITQLSDERRETAQRKLYRDYAAGTAHKFTLPYTYLYLYPGYKVTVTRAEGFTHVMRLTSITGGVGLLECEGVALEPETFNQPANGVFPPGYRPPQPIPAMTVLTLLDTPLLRDGDETNNNGIGFYMCGTPRTGVSQNWSGFALYVNRNGTWALLGDSSLPGTIGAIVSATGLSTDTTIFDRIGHFIVDLYGTTATLSSITEADALADPTKNLAICGDMVVQFVTATQVAGFPNRWDLSVLLNGRRGTEGSISASFTGKRFVLVDGAVKFIPTQLADLNNTMEYRAVTSGQSLGDAATVDFAWTGGTKRSLSIVYARGTRDSEGDLLIEFQGRTRVGGGVRSNQAGPVNEEREEYRVQILNSGSTTLPSGRERIMQVVPGMKMAAVLTSESDSGFDGVTNNNFSSYPVLIGARSVQEIPGPGNTLEAGLEGDFTGGGPTVIALQVAGARWRGLAAQVSSSTIPSAPLLAALADIPYAVISYVSGSGLGPFYQHLYVYEFGTLIFSASERPADSDYDPAFGWGGITTNSTYFRVRFNFVGSTVRIQKAHTLNVPFSTIVTGKRAATFPYFAIAIANNGPAIKVSDVTLQSYPLASTIYSASQQTEDFGSTQSAVQMDIWQYSQLVGDGIKTRVTL